MAREAQPNSRKTAGEPGGFFSHRRFASRDDGPIHRFTESPICRIEPPAAPAHAGRRTEPENSSMPPHNTDDVRIRELKELTPPAT